MKRYISIPSACSGSSVVDVSILLKPPVESLVLVSSTTVTVQSGQWASALVLQHHDTCRGCWGNNGQGHPRRLWLPNSYGILLMLAGGKHRCRVQAVAIYENLQCTRRRQASTAITGQSILLLASGAFPLSFRGSAHLSASSVTSNRSFS